MTTYFYADRRIVGNKTITIYKLVKAGVAAGEVKTKAEARKWFAAQS